MKLLVITNIIRVSDLHFFTSIVDNYTILSSRYRRERHESQEISETQGKKDSPKKILLNKSIIIYPSCTWLVSNSHLSETENNISTSSGSNCILSRFVIFVYVLALDFSCVIHIISNMSSELDLLRQENAKLMGENAVLKRSMILWIWKLKKGLATR